MFTLKELEQQHSSTYSKRVKVLDIFGTNNCRNSSLFCCIFDNNAAYMLDNIMG